MAGYGVPVLDVNGELAQVRGDVHAECAAAVAALAVDQAPALAFAEVVEGNNEQK